MNLLVSDLMKCMPRLSREKAEEYAPLLGAAMTKSQIEAPWRATAFLAQLRHESNHLATWKEIGGERARYAPYYGRGPIQLTGRENYAACGKSLMLDLVGEPDLVLLPDVGIRAAAWFWRSRGLNEVADRIQVDPSAFETISARIHGCSGKPGCACRESRRQCYRAIWPVMSTPTVMT